MKRVISISFVALMLMLTLCSCSFFDNSVKTLELSDTDLELIVGDSKTIGIHIEPADAQVDRIMWSSSDSNIVSVDDGTVKALAFGNAVVTAYTENGVSASCNVSVKEKEITGITLNKPSTSVKVGATIQLTANVTPVDAPTGTLKWSSSDSSVATVNSQGYVTGIKAGVVNIICKSANDIEASCTVTVKSGTDTLKPDANSDADSDDAGSNDADSNANSGTVVNNYYGNFNSGYDYSSSDFIFPDSSTRKLTHSEIQSKIYSMSGYSPTGDYAQDAINEIYARNGYVFKDSGLRAYYQSMPWYSADSSFSYSDFSATERYNLGLLDDYT